MKRKINVFVAFAVCTMAFVGCKKSGGSTDVPDEPDGLSINPLSYFAEYNMADLNGTFDKSHDTSGKYLFTWNVLSKAYGEGKTINGKTYYLPTSMEWMALFPLKGTNTFIAFGEPGVRRFTKLYVTVQGRYHTISGAVTEVDGTIYGTFAYEDDEDPTITFYTIAEYKTVNLRRNSKDGRLEVRMVSTPKQLSIDEAKNAATWKKYSDKVVTRVFPAAGRNDGTHLYDLGVGGNYWSIDSDGVSSAHVTCFDKNEATAVWYTAMWYGNSARLITRK